MAAAGHDCLLCRGAGGEESDKNNGDSRCGGSLFGAGVSARRPSVGAFLHASPNHANYSNRAILHNSLSVGINMKCILSMKFVVRALELNTEVVICSYFVHITPICQK